MSRDECFAQLTRAALRQLCRMLLSKPRDSQTREESNWAKETCIAQREITMLVWYKCLMPSHIYRGGLVKLGLTLPNSRVFYNFLAIYMCWNCIKHSRIFTCSHVLDFPRIFRNWAKLALLALCWLSSPKLWAFGLANWAVRNIRVLYPEIRIMILAYDKFIMMLMCLFLHHNMEVWNLCENQEGITRKNQN